MLYPFTFVSQDARSEGCLFARKFTPGSVAFDEWCALVMGGTAGDVSAPRGGSTKRKAGDMHKGGGETPHDAQPSNNTHANTTSTVLASSRDAQPHVEEGAGMSSGSKGAGEDENANRERSEASKEVGEQDAKRQRTEFS